MSIFFKNGNPVTWHFKHLENLSKSGASLLMIEATVEKIGKITHSDMSLYNNNNFKNFQKLINHIKNLLILKLVCKFLTL